MINSLKVMEKEFGGNIFYLVDDKFVKSDKRMQDEKERNGLY